MARDVKVAVILRQSQRQARTRSRTSQPRRSAEKCRPKIRWARDGGPESCCAIQPRTGHAAHKKLRALAVAKTSRTVRLVYLNSRTTASARTNPPTGRNLQPFRTRNSKNACPDLHKKCWPEKLRVANKGNGPKPGFRPATSRRKIAAWREMVRRCRVFGCLPDYSCNASAIPEDEMTARQQAARWQKLMPSRQSRKC